MSLIGAMDTAITGLNSQSAAFGNISDDVANSQTTGFKRVDTRFEDYLTSSTPTQNLSGSVVALPDYRNDVQGTIVQDSSPLALAITGQGFFPVSQSTGSANGAPIFSPTPEFSRAGDFSLDKNGYIVNGTGQYLNGWTVDPATGVDRTKLAPIQVGQSSYNPVPTSQVNLAANLPTTPDSTTPPVTQSQVYDSLGNQHQLTLTWTQTAGTPNSWQVAFASNDATPAAIGTATVTFGTNGAPPGTIGSITDPSGVTTTYAPNTPASLTVTPNFGAGTQPISFAVGTFGQADGLTNFAGTQLSLRSLTQNGVPAGSFTGLTTQSNGNFVANYSNGQNRVVARVPVVTFANPDALQRQNGQGFTATTDSGVPLAQDAATNGAGGLVTGSTESSNVDIATEFSALIVAQRAYSANAKLVTTADDMLQQTIDMKR